MPPLRRMSFAEYARHRKVTKAAVSLAVKRGKISVETDSIGTHYIDPEKADREWTESTNPALAFGPTNRKNSRKEGAEPVAPPDQEEPPASEPEVEPETGPQTDATGPTVRKVAGPRNYNTARAEREHYNAELARLKFEEQAGKLIAADKVRDEAFQAARYVRDSLLAIPDRVAGELAGETNQFRIHQRLTEEIRRALTSLKVEDDGAT
jgi:hypothetical protein